jgi:hypothetical protein
MNRSRSYFGVVCVVLSMVTAAAAIEYQPLATEKGVEAMVSYNPLGPNNEIVAFIRFVNNNSYKVAVDWKPVIDCGGSEVIKGAAAGFSIDAKSTFEVTLWRSMACGLRQIKNLSVQMTVQRSSGF